MNSIPILIYFDSNEMEFLAISTIERSTPQSNNESFSLYQFE